MSIIINIRKIVGYDEKGKPITVEEYIEVSPEEFDKFIND